MAAQDDKISSNRRKLFKALSAAPVVLTLRPGSALANASAHQCVKIDREEHSGYHWKGKEHESDFEDCSVDGVCKDKVDGAIYKKFKYWMPHSSEDRFYTGSSYSDASCPEVVVERDSGQFFDLDGNQLNNVQRIQDYYGQPAIKMTTYVSGQVRTLCKVKGQDGNGAYIGHTSDHDSKWNEDGYSPKHKPTGWDMGEKQKISMSCLTSFQDAKMKYLANG